MSNIYFNSKSRWLMLLVLVLTSSFAWTQSDGEDLPFQIAGMSDGTDVYLRWIYKDREVWDQALAHGIDIYRMDLGYIDHRDTLTLTEQRASLTTIVEDIQPLSESGWGSKYGDEELPYAAKMMIYSDSLDYQVEGTPNFADAVAKTEKDENRMAFFHFIADQDIHLAMDMGLGYIDDNIDTAKIYMYIVMISDDSLEPRDRASAALRCSSLDHPTLVAPDTLYAVSEDKRIQVGWPLAEVGSLYTSYNIFRSRDGVNFDQINTEPYVFGSEELDDTEMAIFSDSVAQYGVTYYYKVQGKNPFGLMGPLSDVVAVTSKPAKMLIQLFVEDPVLISEQVILTWSTLDRMYSDSLRGYNVYHSVSSEGPFEQTNTTLINPQLRQYEVPSPLPEAYYILEAEDLYGNIYQSPPKLIQTNDVIPPELPRDFRGIALEGDKVRLTWMPNDDIDLLGYRVYRCFSPGGRFALVGAGTIKDTTLVDDLSENVVTDSIYYRIEAYDVRANTSGYSEPIAIKRADASPPAAPTLYKAQPTAEGVALAWRYSDSEDVAYHILRRKPSNAPGWEELLRIAPYQEAQFFVPDPSALTATCWIDTSSLEAGGFDYQISAYDESGNVSSSQVVMVRSRGEETRGEITEFSLDGDCPAQSCYVDLSWAYTVDHTLTDFVIYRSRKGSEMKAYKTLSASSFYGGGDPPYGPQSFAYTDDQVDPSVRYIYRVIARHSGDEHSAPSQNLTVKL